MRADPRKVLLDVRLVDLDDIIRVLLRRGRRTDLHTLSHQKLEQYEPSLAGFHTNVREAKEIESESGTQYRNLLVNEGRVRFVTRCLAYASPRSMTTAGNHYYLQT